MLLFGDAGNAALAQKAAEQAATAANKITFQEAWNDGGVLMWVLAAINILAFAAMLYLWLFQSPRFFVPEALSRIRAAKDPAAAGARIAERVYASVDWLADIAAIAPLVGLLGTVLGIFDAFSFVNSDLNQVDKATKLTQGVSKAVVTTIFGLIVAIPSLVAHAFYRRRASRLLATIEEKYENQKDASDAARA